jgi:hypothetical protein
VEVFRRPRPALYGLDAMFIAFQRGIPAPNDY